MTFKKGDEVRCTLKSSSTLTYGKTYEVIGHSSNDNSIQILDDKGDRLWYYSHNFELVEVSKPTLQELIDLAKTLLGKELIGGETGRVLQERSN